MSKIRSNIPYQIVSMFGPSPCGDNGKDEVIYYCPECESRHGSPDTKGKLYVNIKNFRYHCFRCNYSGQVGRSNTYNESRMYDENKEQDIEDIVSDINSITKGVNKFNLKIPINKVTESDSATKYLLDRGFTYSQMEYYDMRVGNTSLEFGRIVIPNEVDHLVYTDFYSARTYIDQTPKYHNPAQEKSKVVFNLHRIKDGDPVIVVEGALTAVAAGYHAVATLGKTMTRDQASKIASKHPSVVYINYDYGAESYSHDACRLIKSLLPNTPVYEVLMDDDRDAADMTHEEYAQCLSRAKLFEPLYNDIQSLFE